ncbi:MAG TPA: CAP domain-containing protein [Rhizobiaceae bacterium]|nr:CAP domain-containing protein [Rhizobiaceae bacterium]
MAAATPQEQLMLELVNRARLNPTAEAARYGLALSAAQKTPRDVLAMNADLYDAATNHTAWMLRYDIFSHTETTGVAPWKTGTTPQQRVNHTGYNGLAGENIAWTGSLPAVPNPTASILELHKGLFLSAGHRANILNATYDEIGIDQTAGKFLSSGTNWNASMVTQVFGVPNVDRVFVTGVIYRDTVTNDNFFTVGEQRPSKAVSSPGQNKTTGAGGGYELSYAPGAGVTQITIDGKVVSLNLSTRNVKLDLVNDREIWTDGNVTLISTTITEVHALGLKAMSMRGTTASEKFFGNDAANLIFGEAGNDRLDGDGGADRLFGGIGNDIYVVDNASDTVNETGASGTDTVQASVNWNLANAARVLGDIERLMLTGTAKNGFGNGLDNLIYGNSSANSLSGAAGNDILRGSLGNDTLRGGLDQDTFIFNTTPNTSTNRDTISDFTPADDVIHLENAIFAKLGAAGALNPAFFRVGARALDANDYIVYHRGSGALFYDADGNRAGAAIQFATLTTEPLITAADFRVI